MYVFYKVVDWLRYNTKISTEFKMMRVIIMGFLTHAEHGFKASLVFRVCSVGFGI